MKIAFCIPGIVGSLQGKYGIGQTIDPRIGHYFHKKHIFNNNDVDVFIHSWSVNFQNMLIDLYDPKKYIFEKQIDFKQNSLRNNSIKSRWYSTKKVVELKRQYEIENNFEYDCVMLYRFDHVFLRDICLNEFNMDYFYVSHTNMHGLRDIDCNCTSLSMVTDCWLFSNSKNIDIFSQIYDTWKEDGSLNPHLSTKNKMREIVGNDRIKQVLYPRQDNECARALYEDCWYKFGQFNINNLKRYDFDYYPIERFPGCGKTTPRMPIKEKQQLCFDNLPPFWIKTNKGAQD